MRTEKPRIPARTVNIVNIINVLPLLLLLLVQFGCDSNEPGGGLAGDYVLTSVDGLPLPAHFTITVGEYTVESGSLEIASGGSFNLRIDGFSDPLGPTGQSDFTVANSGSISRSGDAVSFNTSQGDFNGTVVGDNIDVRIQTNGIVRTYRMSR